MAAFLPLPALPTARRARAAPAQPTCSQARSLDTALAAGLGAGVAAVLLVTAALPGAGPALDASSVATVALYSAESSDDEASLHSAEASEDEASVAGGSMYAGGTYASDADEEAMGVFEAADEGSYVAEVDAETTYIAVESGTDADATYLAEVDVETSYGVAESAGEVDDVAEVFVSYAGHAGELAF